MDIGLKMNSDGAFLLMEGADGVRVEAFPIGGDEVYEFVSTARIGQLEKRYGEKYGKLIAFRKVLLQPGEEQEVTFHLDRTASTYINRAEERVFAPGDFMLMAGHSAKDEDLLKETVWVG